MSTSSDSYTITPLIPNLSDTFNVLYTTNAFQVADDASYTLINDTTGSVLQTIRSPVTAFNTIVGGNGDDFPTIYELPNSNIFFVAHANTQAPFSAVYSNTGTLLSQNNSQKQERFGMTSDASYVYAAGSNGYFRYTFNAQYNTLDYDKGVGGSTWSIGPEYNPNDKCIYASFNGDGINKFDISNNTTSTFINRGTSDSMGGIAFNSDYSYIYAIHRSSGNIRYFQLSNLSNTGVLTTIPSTPTSVSGYTTAYGITCNRSKNVLFISCLYNSSIYAVKLITNTTASQPQQIYTLNTFAYSLYYSNTRNRLIVLDNNNRVYVLNDASLSFTNMPGESLVGGTNTLTIQRNGVNFGNPITVNATCFLEGTRILCLTDTYEEEYVKIENMKQGMLVKTHLHGFKPIHSIGKGTIYNPNENTLTKDRLYVISKTKCPVLTEDLYITGNHSVLVPSLTDDQREKIVEYMKEIYITDDHYRLPACLDDRFTECVDSGNKTIWHFALENDDIFGNYGVYANGGLLVETCSIRYLSELSTLELQE